MANWRSASALKSNKLSRISAMSIVAAAYAVAPSNSFGNEPIAPACRGAGNELAQLRCSTALSKKATAAANARSRIDEGRIVDAQARGKAADANGKAADIRSATADAETSCMKLIMTDMESNGAKTSSLEEFPKRGDACRVAKELGLATGS